MMCGCVGGTNGVLEESNGMDEAMEEVVMGRKEEEEDGGVDKRSSRVEWWQATTRRVTAKVPELKSDRADP